MQPDLPVRRYVGLKQSTEAVNDGLVKKAYIALDADEHVRLPFETLCRERNIPIEFAQTKAKLGKSCGINVPAAVAVELI